MDGVFEFRRIINLLIIIMVFLEIKYFGFVFMNYGYIDVGEIDMEFESQISLDVKGYIVEIGLGVGKGIVGGSYGG